MQWRGRAAPTREDVDIDVTDRVIMEDHTPAVLVCAAISVGNRFEQKQMFCTEMLHWDELRKETGIADGTQMMSKLFRRCTIEDPLPIPVDIQGGEYKYQSVVVQQVLKNRPSQPFCSEMQHWDDVCATQGTAPTTPSMTLLFKPFPGRALYTLNRKSGVVTRDIGNSVALKYPSAEKQCYCAEMEHWDDTQTMAGASPTQSMAQLFAPKDE